MDFVQTVVLALLQGVLEFLPVSSSGHLILVPVLLGWPDQGLGYDIAVHFGTLLAVIAYFRRDLTGMAAALLDPQRGEFRLAWGVLIGTVPLGLGALALSEEVETTLRAPLVIAAATGLFGVLLWAADRWQRGERTERELTWYDAVAIGCGQAFALVPGTSRSGITITVALALGMSRQAASRFSFLLAIPALALAAAWQIVRFTRAPEPVQWVALGIATAVSAVTAFATIALFLAWIGRIGMGAFALYRLVLAAAIAGVYWLG